MNTDQARRIVTLHDQHDRVLANLRNAAAMSTDDPRATELLEEAGDAYAASLAALFSEQVPLRMTAPQPETDPGFEPGEAAYIVEEGHGAGLIEDRGDMKEGYVPLRLTTDAHFRGQDFPKGNLIAVAIGCLSLEAPAEKPSAPETPSEDPGKGGAGAAKD